MISCDSLKLKNSVDPSQNLSENIALFCFNSDGKGRIEYSNQNYLFSYEARFQNKSWVGGFFFSLYGDEYLELEKKENNQMKLSGTFVKRLFSSVREESEKEMLRMFLKQIGKFIFLTKDKSELNLKNCTLNEKWHECSWDNGKISWKNEQEISQIKYLVDQHELFIEGRAAEGQMYKKVIMALNMIDAKNKNERKEQVKFNFFPQACLNITTNAKLE